jgi:hypothetical protein
VAQKDDLIPGIPEASAMFGGLSSRAAGLYETQSGKDAERASLSGLIDGADKFFAIATRLDDGAEPFTQADISQLGDYGLNLLAEFGALLAPLGEANEASDVSPVILAVTGWIVRRDGRIGTLEPVVDALAYAANHTTDGTALARLADFMGSVLGACTDIIKSDLETANPGRPWRILQLNRGIVATRSLNPRLMADVFDELCSALPEDVARFFSDGMQEMDKLGYPQEVREVMTRYFDRWSRPKMN